MMYYLSHLTSTNSMRQKTFFQKIKSLDFYLLISIIILGAISILAMYSTDISDGNFYHSFNHALRFVVFFCLMILLSLDRKSTRLNSSHSQQSRMPSSA